MQIRSNREIGDAFDAEVKTLLEPVMPGLKMTIGSGSVFGDQDQYSNDYRISVKYRTNKGLTLREVMEPYGREAIGKTRCPVTVLRLVEEDVDSFSWKDFALVDGRVMSIYGRRLWQTVIERSRLDIEVLENWPGGLTRSLLRGLEPGQIQIMLNFPPGEHSFLMFLKDFVSLLSDIEELQYEQRSDPESWLAQSNNL